jgi:cellulose synthase operon protein C
MKRLNVKLLIIVVVTTVVLTLGVVGVHALQTNRNVGSLLDLAKQAEEAGDYRGAINFYGRYVAYDPDDAETMAKYALAYLKLAESPDGTKVDLGKAAGALQESVQKLQVGEHRETLNIVRNKLVDLLVKYHQYVQAKDHLVRMKAENTAAGKDDPAVDLRLAKCYLATANYTEAIKLLNPLVGYDAATKTFDTAKATAPKEIEAYEMLVSVLRSNVIPDSQLLPNRRELADRVIEQLAKANPDDEKAILLQARDMLPRSVEKARPLVERALTLAPNKIEPILLAAQIAAVNDKDLPKAEKLLQHGLKENPKDPRAYRVLLEHLMLQNRMDEAAAIVKDGLTKLPNNFELLETRFKLNMAKKDYAAAKRDLSLLDPAQVPFTYREFLECQLLISQERLTDAQKRLQSLRPKVVGNKQFMMQVDAMLMQLAQALNQPDKILEYSNTLPPDWLPIQLAKAKALLARGDSDGALSAFEGFARSLEKDPAQFAKTQAVWRPLYELRVAKLMREPKDSRNWQSIDSLLKTLREQKALPEPSLSLLELDALVRKEDVAGTQLKLNELVKQYPSDPAVLAASARFLAQQRGDSAEALAMLDKLGPELQRDPLIFSTRIECIVADKSKPEEQLQKLSKLGESAAGWPEEARRQIYASLGVATIQLNDIKEARRWFGKASELRPDDERLKWYLFDLARSQSDQAAMKEIGEWYAKVKGADSAEAQLIQASQIVTNVRTAVQQTVSPNQNEIFLDANQRAALKKARSLMGEVKNERASWHEIYKLLAEVDILENRLDEAILNLKEALETGPPNGRLVQQLVQLLFFRNDPQGARDYMEKYSAFVGNDLERLRIGVDEQLGGGKPLTDDEIAKLVKKDSTNPSDQMYLASLLSRSGKNDEAEAAYRKAISLNPDSPEAWLALIGHFWRQKKGIEAHQVVQEAQIQLPEDRRALTLAQGYEVLNDLGQADQFYLAALDAAPDDLAVQRAVAANYLRTERAAKAKPYLDKMISTSAPAEGQADNVAWARRESAKLLAKDPNYQEFLKAMDLLKPTQGITPAPQDLALKAALLSERGEPGSAKEALKLLTTLAEQRPLQTLERLLLAQVRERLGDWGPANREMTLLVTQSKPTPTIYVAYIEMLLRNDNASEASRWLQKLKETAPDTPQIPALAARVDAAQGNGARAAVNLKKELPAQRPLPKEQWRRLFEIASLLEQIKQYDEAEKLLREYVGYVPQETLFLAKFLADRGKVDETIALVERLRQNAPPTPLLQILLAAMRQNEHPPTKEQKERIEAFFARAMRDDPESSLIQIQYAGLQESKHNFAEAERLYREVFKRSETRPFDRAVVANNLGYLLAIQGKDLDDAVRFVKISLDFMGPQSDILDTRGLIFLAQGNAAQAVADLKDATIGPNDPNRANKLFHLALAYAANKEEAKARETLKKASDLKLKPDDLSPVERAKYDALVKQLGQKA